MSRLSHRNLLVEIVRASYLLLLSGLIPPDTLFERRQASAI
jgi:hypothetical protein